jgi:hypothetical protein
MEDRANVAIAAMRAISKLDDIDANRIGFLGFSQAGWVLPRGANRIAPAFIVIVGAAVSWRDQGTYCSRVEMTSLGIEPALIEQHLADRTRKYDAMFAVPGDP